MDDVIDLFPTPVLRVPGVLERELVAGLVERFSRLAVHGNSSSANLSHTELLQPADSPLFVAAAARIQATMRETDTVARVGGDEFVVLSLGTSEDEEAAALAGRIRHALRRSYRVDGGVVELSTAYTYEVRWGMLGRVFDRVLFRPLMQWATERSFARLRRYFPAGASRVAGAVRGRPERLDGALVSGAAG